MSDVPKHKYRKTFKPVKIWRGSFEHVVEPGSLVRFQYRTTNGNVSNDIARVVAEVEEFSPRVETKVKRGERWFMVVEIADSLTFAYERFILLDDILSVASPNNDLLKWFLGFTDYSNPDGIAEVVRYGCLNSRAIWSVLGTDGNIREDWRQIVEVKSAVPYAIRYFEGRKDPQFLPLEILLSRYNSLLEGLRRAAESPTGTMGERENFYRIMALEMFPAVQAAIGEYRRLLDIDRVAEVQQERQDEADKACEGWDGEGCKVLSRTAWDKGGDEWTCVVTVRTETNGEMRRGFIVRFVPNSTIVKEAYAGDYH